jgi:hypothetical protein
MAGLVPAIHAGVRERVYRIVAPAAPHESVGVLKAAGPVAAWMPGTRQHKAGHDADGVEQIC